MQFLFLIISGLIGLILAATPALANEPFVIGGSGIAETRVISHANALSASTPWASRCARSSRVTRRSAGS